jgi:NAD(P)-dependent dehydrogenase (short-subunit alcohol dehydrogenase family)
MTLPADPVWFITGCSTGFGRAFAELVLNRGWRVVATARSLHQIADLQAKGGERCLTAEVDVNDPAQVKTAVNRAMAHFGRIDVLVNNAGYGYLAAIEEGEEDEIRAMFDTNVFGLAAMTRTVLPHMRAQGSGAVVNITSIGGLMSFPGSGYYSATKFAVEGLSEALAAEVKPLGIDVLIVEPGPFRTDWAGRSLKTPKTAIGAYAETAGARRGATQGYSGFQPGDPRRAGEAIITALSAPKPPLRLPVGAFAVASAKQKYQRVLEEFETWTDLGLSADFPENER